MGIGTSLAIGMGVAAAANAGAQIYGAKTASKASKQAAKIQTDAADRASRLMDEHLLPYVNKGRETISTLGRLTAAPPGSRFAAPDPTLPRPAASGNRAVPRGGTLGALAGRRDHGALGPGGSGMAMPPGEVNAAEVGRMRFNGPQGRPGMDMGTLGPSGGPRVAPNSANVSTLGDMAMQPPAGDQVVLQAPDGSVRAVPAHMAQALMQKGARRIQ